MSFKINANGTKGFHYARAENPDENLFITADIISAMGSVSGPNLKGLGGGGADYVLPSIDGTTRDAISSYAKLGFTYALTTAVNRLAAFRSAAQGSIAVSATQSKLLGDKMGFARYAFSPGIQPGLEFVQIIAPTLETTGLNHYGSLRALTDILNKYYDFLDDEKDRPVILIEIIN
ncbi:MAG: hypothetical protein ABI999_13770 [Acidobacteriota bacterium]